MSKALRASLVLVLIAAAALLAFPGITRQPQVARHPISTGGTLTIEGATSGSPFLIREIADDETGNLKSPDSVLRVAPVVALEGGPPSGTVKVTFPFDSSWLLPAESRGRVYAAYWDGSRWQPVPTEITPDGAAVFATAHFSLWTLFVESVQKFTDEAKRLVAHLFDDILLQPKPYSCEDTPSSVYPDISNSQPIIAGACASDLGNQQVKLTLWNRRYFYMEAVRTKGDDAKPTSGITTACEQGALIIPPGGSASWTATVTRSAPSVTMQMYPSLCAGGTQLVLDLLGALPGGDALRVSLDAPKLVAALRSLPEVIAAEGELRKGNYALFGTKMFNAITGADALQLITLYLGKYVTEGKVTEKAVKALFIGIKAGEQLQRIADTFYTRTATGGNPTATIQFRGPPVPPAQPQGLSGPDLSCRADGRVTAIFHWQPSSDADGHWVDLSLLDNGFLPGTFLGQDAGGGDISEFTWSGLDPGERQYWRVVAYRVGPDATMWSQSVKAEFTTPECPSPPPPQSLSATTTCQPGGKVSVTFNWQPVDWAGGYVVDLSLDPLFLAFLSSPPYPPIPGNASQYEWAGLDAGKTHYWRVYAYKWDGDKVVAEATAMGPSFATPACAPTPPPPAATNVFKEWQVGVWKGSEFKETRTFAPDDGAFTVGPIFDNCSAGREWESRWLAPGGKLVAVGHGTATEASPECDDDYDTWRTERVACFPGTWTREVDMNGQTYSTTFKIDRAPPMELAGVDIGYDFNLDTGVVGRQVTHVTMPGTVYFVQRWRYVCSSHRITHTLTAGGEKLDFDPFVMDWPPPLPIRNELPVPEEMGPRARYAGLSWSGFQVNFTASDIASLRGPVSITTKVDGVPMVTQGVMVGR